MKNVLGNVPKVDNRKQMCICVSADNMWDPQGSKSLSKFLIVYFDVPSNMCGKDTCHAGRHVKRARKVQGPAIAPELAWSELAI